MSFLWAVPALLGVALLGFGAGLLSFKIKNRWCPSCGTTLRCPACAGTKSVPNALQVRGAAR
jgi:NADH pyrophosphatase NudC (nudix superfamily)